MSPQLTDADIAKHDASVGKVLTDADIAARDTNPQGYLSQVGTGLWNTVKGLAEVGSEAGGVLAEPWKAVEHLKNLKKMVLDPQVDQAIKAADEWKQGHRTEAAGHAMAAVLPGLGPAAANIGEKLGNQDYTGAAADATVLGATMVAPHVAGAVTDAASGISKVALDPAVVKAGIKVIPKGSAALDLINAIKSARGRLRAATDVPASFTEAPIQAADIIGERAATPAPASFTEAPVHAADILGQPAAAPAAAVVETPGMILARESGQDWAKLSAADRGMLETVARAQANATAQPAARPPMGPPEAPPPAAANPYLKTLDPKKLKFTESGQNNEPYVGDSSKPITVTEGDGSYQVLDGHHRALDAAAKGKTIDAVVIPADVVKQFEADGIHPSEMKLAFARKLRAEGKLPPPPESGPPAAAAPEPAPSSPPAGGKPAAADIAAQLEASMRAEALTDAIVRKMIPPHIVEKFSDAHWNTIAREAGVEPPNPQQITQILDNLAQREAAKNITATTAPNSPAEAAAEFQQNRAIRNPGEEPPAAAAPEPAPPPQPETPPAGTAAPKNAIDVPGIADRPPSKWMTEDGLRDYAAENKLTEDAARTALTESGYKIRGRRMLNSAIHALGGELGLDHELLRETASITYGVKSLTQLTQDQMLEMYNHLAERQAAAQPLMKKTAPVDPLEEKLKVLADKPDAARYIEQLRAEAAAAPEAAPTGAAETASPQTLRDLMEPKAEAAAAPRKTLPEVSLEAAAQQLDEPGFRSYDVKAGNRSIGSMDLIEHPNELEVDLSHLLEPFRGKGYGKAMYLEAIERARQLGKRNLISGSEFTEDAARVWRSLGGEQFTDAHGETRWRLPVEPAGEPPATAAPRKRQSKPVR